MAVSSCVVVQGGASRQLLESRRERDKASGRQPNRNPRLTHGFGHWYQSTRTYILCTVHEREANPVYYLVLTSLTYIQKDPDANLRLDDRELCLGL